MQRRGYFFSRDLNIFNQKSIVILILILTKVNTITNEPNI